MSKSLIPVPISEHGTKKEFLTKVDPYQSEISPCVDLIGQPKKWNVLKNTAASQNCSHVFLSIYDIE